MSLESLIRHQLAGRDARRSKQSVLECPGRRLASPRHVPRCAGSRGIGRVGGHLSGRIARRGGSRSSRLEQREFLSSFCTVDEQPQPTPGLPRCARKMKLTRDGL